MSNLPDTPEPSGSAGYFKPSKLTEGKPHDIRILGPARAYMLAWKTRRPVRKEYGEAWREVEFDEKDFNGQPQVPRLAWAFPIFNYDQGIVQVWEVTQSTVRKEFRALAGNKRWGALEGYDISITRTKDGDKTSYSIQPVPPSPLSGDALEAWTVAQACNFSLEALMTGGDPFNTDGKRKTSRDEILDPPFDELNPPPATDADIPF
jgi:hypothetical protein